MSTFQSAQEIAQNRQLRADALLNGQCDLRGYPFRHLTVVADGGFFGGPDPTVVITMAAEYLSQFGWELVSVTKPIDSVNRLVAFLRLT